MSYSRKLDRREFELEGVTDVCFHVDVDEAGDKADWLVGDFHVCFPGENAFSGRFYVVDFGVPIGLA